MENGWPIGPPGWPIGLPGAWISARRKRSTGVGACLALLTDIQVAASRR